MGCGVVGRELEILVRVGGLRYTLVEREPSSLCNIVTSKNGITRPCSLSEVNWMFWLMELTNSELLETNELELPTSGDSAHARCFERVYVGDEDNRSEGDTRLMNLQ